MLLPSDIARLVLGYLQEEGLSATSRAFIHESPNLKEYAEHSTEDGTIPACVFSIFGKGLTTILNEYVAVKTKESNHQVPAMVSSLWKKLDFTLNQIKSLQNSPALSACQRIRTRVGMANVARQKALTNSPTSSVMCTTVSETLSIVSPAQTSHCVLTHSTPVSFSGAHRLTAVTAPQLQNHDGSRLLNTPRESPVNVTDHRLNPAPLSPGRRKWKRSGVVGGSSSSSRPAAASGAPPEEEPEEIADETFPQLVIQNARDKILGDRLLQEKLAENINKILASEPTPQSSKACTNIVEPDQSIDEILGLQGEIHMSDDAIHDILEQTESDPAFQALFDLFEYNKTKAAEGELGDGDISSSPDEGDLPAPVLPLVAKPCQNVDSAVVQKEAPDPASVKATATERKTRKSAPALKKTVITSSRSSRIDNCLGNLLVVQEPRQGTSSAKTSEKSPHPGTTPMEIDEPQAAATTITTNVPPTSVASVSDFMPLSLTSMVSETTNLNRFQENKGAQRSTNTKDSASSAPQTAPSSSPSTSGKGAHLASSTLASPETSKATTKTVSPSTSALPVSVSNSSASSMAEQSGSNKTGDNPNDIVSLKIIISENQEEDSAADTALNQAVSSISGDKIPTIYLSSPARTPAVLGTPRSTSDEAAQAVSCLQRSETVVGSPLNSQQSYIIQLPFDGAATSATSYFVLTEPPAPDAHSRQMIMPAPVTKGQAIAPNPFTLTPQRPGFSAGSTLILPSPMKSVVLPLSVMGQNTLGNVQMVSNQLVAVPNSPLVPQTETVKPLPAGAVKQSAPSAPDKNVNNKMPPSVAPVTQSASASPGSAHRRILRFDSNGESQTSKANTPPSAPTSQPLPRTKPSILSANKPKRRIEPVRCSDTEKTPPPKEKRGSRKQEYVCNKEPGSSSSEVSKSVETRRRSKSADGKQNNTGEDNNRAKDSSHSKASSSDSSKPAESRKRSKSTDGKQNDMDEAKDSSHSKSSSDSSQKSGSRKEKEPAEKGKSRDSRAEKRIQETTSVTANKENELKGQEQQSASSSAAPAQAKSSKAQSKTSALAKQAAEMLHDIQALNSPSAPKELSGQEESGSDCPKTPMRTRKGREAEGTPRHLVPPNGSDAPTCSPASEAGSESSINMAAHTLMILSRSALARPGTPLKDSLRQEGAGERSPTAAKNAKKRKQSTPTSSPPAKKEPKRTPTKKKERKKLMECFPQDLDVDKFLSSLHYDE